MEKVTLDVTVAATDANSPAVRKDVWEIEVSKDVGKVLIDNADRSLSGMSPHSDAYRFKLLLEKYMDALLKLNGEELKKIRGIKESE